MLTAGKASTVIQPTDKTPVYEIQAGKINTIRIGPQVRVSFSARYSGGTVTISPSVKIFGSAEEEYTIDFSGGTGRPHVLMYEGKRRLQDIPMKYG